jgi:hypothetical protein
MFHLYGWDAVHCRRSRYTDIPSAGSARGQSHFRGRRWRLARGRTATVRRACRSSLYSARASASRSARKSCQPSRRRGPHGASVRSSDRPAGAAAGLPRKRLAAATKQRARSSRGPRPTQASSLIRCARRFAGPFQGTRWATENRHHQFRHDLRARLVPANRPTASKQRMRVHSGCGIARLHGCAPSPWTRCGSRPRLSRNRLVLSSANFGEAYMRSGWASRLVYDLLRRYTLVLVGYSADDPPMR